VWYESVKLLAEEGFLLWAVPALAYSVWVAFDYEDRVDTLRALFFPIFVALWMFWYVFASIGWPRYAYPGLAVSSILVAKLMVDVAMAFRLRVAAESAASRRRGRLSKLLGSAPLLLFIAILVAWPLQNAIRRIASGNNEALYAFAQYIEANLPGDARIASEEWEVDFLTQRTYFHVPGHLIVAYIQYKDLGYPINGGPYDVASVGPQYIIDGPNNKVTRYISEDFLRVHAKLVVSMGEYDLYRIAQE